MAQIGVAGLPQGEKNAYVCLAPDCTRVMYKRGGGYRKDAKYCSDSCRNKAFKAGVRYSPLDKAAELSLMADDVRKRIDSLMGEAKELGAEHDHLTRLYHIANMNHVDSFVKELESINAHAEEVVNAPFV